MTGEPDAEAVRLEVDGVRWTVRVLGRSGGSGAGVTPLLLLGFWKGEPRGERETDRPGPHAREALVAARTLSGLSEGDLGDALSRSDPPRPPDGQQ
jgi:hypothetical protein